MQDLSDGAIRIAGAVRQSGKAYVRLQSRKTMRQIFPVELPFIPEDDFSGVVDSVRESVLDFRVGNHLYGYTVAGGAYAEFLANASDKVALKPKGINHDQAASLAIVGRTALQNVGPRPSAEGQSGSDPGCGRSGG